MLDRHFGIVGVTSLSLTTPEPTALGEALRVVVGANLGYASNPPEVAEVGTSAARGILLQNSIKRL